MRITKTNIMWMVGIGVLLLVMVVVLLCWHGPHKWDPASGYNTQGDDPYDMELFDELLTRSLPNGYTVYQPAKVKTESEHDAVRDNLTKTSTDTALLVVGTPLRGTFPNTNVVRELCRFAKSGGEAVMVMYNSTLLDKFTTDDYGNLSLGWDYYGQPVPYTREWYSTRTPGTEQLITEKDDTLTTDGRFNINTYYLTDEEGNYWSDRIVHRYIPAHDPNGMRCQLRLTMVPTYTTNEAYVVDVYYPKSGGHLTLTSLGPYFCNLGLRLPAGPEVISEVMGRVDDRPVKRWMYPRDNAGSWATDDDDMEDQGHRASIIDKIGESPALSLIWTLLLGGVVLWLLCGLVRRYPVMRGAEIEQLDKTDAVAVREYQFRHSPLLHFMFQCSWLYKGAADYSELFDIDYRRLSRVVSRMTGVDLREATDDDLDTMSQNIAGVLKRPAADIKAELKWMRETKDAGGIISPKAYARGHAIVERYPF